jgi:hypothetical protein
MTLRRLLSLLALGLCATALVGCGGDTLSFDPVAHAAGKTVDTQSARVAFSATINAEGVGTMSFDGTGAYDGRTRSGWMDMKLNIPFLPGQAGRNPRMQMVFDGSDGLVMYMRSSLFSSELPGGKSWVKMDLAKLAGKEGADLQRLMNANQASPEQSLRMLMASSDTHVINYDRVRGVLTTHYGLNVDLRRLAKQDEELRKSLDQLIDLTGADSFPAEAWIDSQGRVRKLKVTMSMGANLGQNFTMTMVEELYAFGTRVKVALPPASQVVDFSALLGTR